MMIQKGLKMNLALVPELMARISDWNNETVRKSIDCCQDLVSEGGHWFDARH
jgi:hypothetical protein